MREHVSTAVMIGALRVGYRVSYTSEHVSTSHDWCFKGWI